MARTPKNKKWIPGWLVPKIKKKHARQIFKDDLEPWLLFAEGCLRNRFFHDAVIDRGTKCLACERAFTKKDAKNRSKIEKHHTCYIRKCIGPLLPPDSDDITRPADPGQKDQVPDCRQCAIDNPEYFKGCVFKINPVHAACHEKIHKQERELSKQVKAKILNHFIGEADDVPEEVQALQDCFADGLE